MENLEQSKIDTLKQQICDAGRKMKGSGLVAGTWGNISLRVNSDFMVITPSGLGYDDLQAEDVVLVNIHDLTYEGKKPSTECKIHAGIYESRKDVNAIIHNHSMNASTVAAARREVPPILDDMAQIIGPSIRVAEYGLPGSKKITKATIKALKGRNGVLMANHGALCVGRDLDECFTNCIILEKACKVFIEAEFLGGAKSISKFEATVMHQYYLRKYSKIQKK